MPERPNIVLISTHDTGRHLGCYGADTVHTPNIDGLADAGYRFTEFNTTCPQCAPSRCSLLTGQYPQRHGMMGLPSTGFGWELRNPADHLSHRLHEAGFETALFGFQHEASDVSALGFDIVDQSADSGPENGANAAEYFSNRDRDRPFYAQIGLFETHEPLDYGGAVPDREHGVDVPPYYEDNEAAREYFAQLQGAIRQADEAVGTVLAALDDAGLRENTIVVFTSDHGYTFSRAKGFLYDAGIGVPLLMHWPDGDVDGGHTCDWLVSAVDFVPTLFDMLDLGDPDNVEGTSFAAFTDSAATEPRDAVFAMFHDHRRWGFGPDARCIRTHTHKLIRNFAPGAHFDPPIDLSKLDSRSQTARLGRDGLKSGPSRPPAEFYDLAADPNEFDNLAPECEDDETYLELTESLREHMQSVDDPVLERPPATPFYDRAIGDFTH